ncbi:hypothetical protein RZN22_06985 [Bacillaceae bacterium S4-13-58]
MMEVGGAQEYDIYDLISRINRLEVKVDENGNEIEELRLILDKKTDGNQVIVNVEEFLAKREFFSKGEVKVIVNREKEKMNHKLKQMQLNT